MWSRSHGWKPWLPFDLDRLAARRAARRPTSASRSRRTPAASSSASISLSRLSGVLVGQERLRPRRRSAARRTASRYARRTNSSSVQRSDGGMRHLLQLGEDVLVDVVRSPAGSARRSPARGSRYVSRTDTQLFEVAAQDGDLAGPLELDQAVRRHVGDRRVAAAEDGQPGHVADGAVGERARRRRAAATAPGPSARATPGSTSTFLTAGSVGGVVLQPLGEPARAIISAGHAGRRRTAARPRAARGRAPSAASGWRPGRACRCGGRDVAGQLQVVGGRVEAAEARA